jgi:citrate lyase subunit beta/citryl-CoA lyase
VAVTLTDAGGLDATLASKVASMYGDRIRTEIAEALEGLGVAHAKIEVEDAGALPFVLAARIEAAVRRADPDTPREHRLPLDACARGGTTRERFRRSRLYLPGNEPKFAINAGLYGADAIILDLEDSVAPAEKDAARVLVRNALSVLDFGRAERMVRINQGALGIEDLRAVIPHNVHVVLVPKCESARDVVGVAETIEEVARAHGINEPVYLMPIVESAAGALSAREIAAAHPTVVALAIGLEDYTADIGAERSATGDESFWARAMVVNAARAAHIPPIDSVYADVGNEAGLRESAARSRSLGFDGMGCIHPRQVRVIHEAFEPAEAVLERAKAIVLRFDEAEARGLGVVSLGTKMIDPPVVKRALRTVALAVASGRLPADWKTKEGAPS